MYLVITNNGDQVLNSANEVKEINKNEVIKIYALAEVNYDDLVSTFEIRDCIYGYLKGKQMTK